MFKTYVAKLVFRIAIFSIVVFFYLTDPSIITDLLNAQHGRITGLHVIWSILMLGMILQIIPEDKYAKITMGSRKQFAETYRPPTEGYEKTSLYEYILHNNVRSWVVLLVWMTFNGIFALLYVMDIIGAGELILLSMFFYVADLICVLIWCPFQHFIVKNRCCITCRIFNWGHFMMYTPLLFIKGFFTWSLFFMSIVVLIRWEITYAWYPQRFWEGSNLKLRCDHCDDKICKIKKPYRTDVYKQQ
jgi:hypothetical protein